MQFGWTLWPFEFRLSHSSVTMSMSSAGIEMNQRKHVRFAAPFNLDRRALPCRSLDGETERKRNAVGASGCVWAIQAERDVFLGKWEATFHLHALPRFAILACGCISIVPL